MSKTKDVFYYSKLVQSATKKEEKYRKECAEIETSYTAEKLFNVLFSNVDLLLSALTSNNPKPVIRVRYPKQQTKNNRERNLARIVGETAERAAIYNNDSFSFKDKERESTQSGILAGRGVLWSKYEHDIETREELQPVPMPDGSTAYEAVTIEEIKNQKVTVDSLDYTEFRCTPTKKWEQVWWVSRLHLLDREELENKFGDRAKSAPLNYVNTLGEEDNKTESCKLAAVWELWDKRQGKVIFFIEDWKILLAEDDPYNLPEFFPCAKPIYFIKGKNTVPVPEYRIYKKTAAELERICSRIARLVRNIKATAIANGRYKDMISKLQNGEDNDIVTTDAKTSSGDIAQSGGLAGIISEYPNQQKSAVLSVLETRKQNAISEIYEITGIADILRGVSNPQETAKAQEIKGQYGSLRLRARQAQLQDFIRDTFKIITALICEFFTKETLQDLTSITLPTEEEKAAISQQVATLTQSGQPVPQQMSEVLDLPTWDEVIAALRENKLRNYIIEVESTATAFEDDEINKARRMELFTTVTNTIQSTLPAMGQFPALADMFKSLINFTIDAFPQSRTLKESIEEALNTLTQQFKAPKQQQQPNPEMVIAQAEMMRAQAELETAKARQLEAQAKMAQVLSDTNIDKATLLKDIKRDNDDLAIQEAKLRATVAGKEADLMLKINQNARTPIIGQSGL